METNNRANMIMANGCYSHYPIYISSGILSEVGRVLKESQTVDRVFIVSDQNVWSYFGEKLEHSIQYNKLRYTVAILSPGEKSKSLATLLDLYHKCIKADVDRHSSVLAFGGGMVGDISGFLAATYLRGIHYINIPTSLVAMTNASIGGKVGINYEGAKNIIGTFKDPDTILIDIDTLITLPAIARRWGIAELAVTSIVSSPDLFEYLERYYPFSKYVEVVEKGIQAKLSVTSQDPLDQLSIRAKLNLGHTFGHALESVSNFTLGHGDAVSIGTEIAAVLSVQLGICTPLEKQRISCLLNHLDLLTTHNFDPSAVLRAMKYDKKKRSGHINLVLPIRIGDVQIISQSEIAEAEILNAIEEARR